MSSWRTATKYILLTGLPGVGKTTAAKYFASKMDGVYVNSDDIRMFLFPDERTYSPEETFAVIKESHRQVNEALREKKTVIHDALFTKHSTRVRELQYALRGGAHTRLVYVTAPESAIQERMKYRTEGNKESSEANFDFYLDRKRVFEQPPLQGTWPINNEGDTAQLEKQVDEVIREWKNEGSRELRLDSPSRK